MPINAGYEYIAAEKKYLQANTLEEKIAALEEMIRHVPGHKGGENLRAELRTRLKKFLEKQEKSKKTGSSTKKSIKKEGYQCVIIGFTNKGKSSILEKLTNAKPKISPNPFTTQLAEVGTLDYKGVKSQIVDLPSIGSSGFDVGIVNTADCIIIVIENLTEIEEIEKAMPRARGKRIIVINKSDRLSEEELRKLQATIKSKKIDGIIVSAATNQGIEELKEKIFNNMGVVRIYMKEPGKAPSNIPMVLQPGASVKDVAEKILKGFSKRVKETRVTGPSSKFPNQKVGINHVLKDKDVIEFHTS